MINKKGFGLLEILVVMVIIAIIVAIMFPTFIEYIEGVRSITGTSDSEEPGESPLQAVSLVEARIGLVAAQTVLNQYVLTAIGYADRESAAIAAVDAINISGTPQRTAFENKLSGAGQPQWAPNATTPGFSGIQLSGTQVVGITYNDGNNFTTIGG